MLGGQFGINDVPSGDDLVQFRGHLGPRHGDSDRDGWPGPGPPGGASGSGGWIDPTLDSSGDAVVEWVAAVGDTMIFVNEWTAAKPDPAAATALLHQQYDRLKNAS